MMSEPIYLDGHATAPLAPEARDAMLAAWARPGNPTSPHRDGERAARIVDAARADVARLIGASPPEIVFTSGATEANNIVLIGLARRAVRLGDTRRRIAISAVEHKSILSPADSLRSQGFQVDVIPVDRNGVLDIDVLQSVLGPDTLLVSVMAANNETGVLQPLTKIAALVHSVGALFHVDAAQAAGKIVIDVFELDLDYMSLSAHKLHGPLGVGALFIAAGSPIPDPLQFGGGQQNGLRPGTEPAPLLAGFGAAARVAAEQMESDVAHRAHLAEALLQALSERQIGYMLTTGEAVTLTGSLSILLPYVDAEDLCQKVASKISISTGSACNSGQLDVSHVLKAMGIESNEIRSVVRVFCSRYNNLAEMDVAASVIADAVRQSRLVTGEVRQ